MLAARAVEIGRIDDYLGEFYRKDLKTGRITHDQAVRLLDNFFTIIETQLRTGYAGDYRRHGGASMKRARTNLLCW